MASKQLGDPPTMSGPPIYRIRFKFASFRVGQFKIPYDATALERTEERFE